MARRRKGRYVVLVAVFAAVVCAVVLLWFVRIGFNDKTAIQERAADQSQGRD